MYATRGRCPVDGLHISAGPNGQPSYGFFPSQIAAVSLASQGVRKHQSDVSELFNVSVIQINRCLSRVPIVMERSGPFPKGKSAINVSSHVRQVKALVVDWVRTLWQKYPEENCVYVLGIIEQTPDSLDLARTNSKTVIDPVVS